MLATVVFVATLFPGNKQIQMMLVVFGAFVYVLWGIVHHYINHNLKTKIVIEYILIGGLGISAIFFLLKGSGL